MIEFSVLNISKKFNKKFVFENLSFQLSDSNSIAIIGKNGSGKSTFLKICAGVLSPFSGNVEIKIDSKNIDKTNFFLHIGFVAPYLQLYDELTPTEHLEFCCNMKNVKFSKSVIEKVLEEVNLENRKNDFVRTFSSGMKQRLKYATAILHKPEILILDEPTVNLDKDGCETVKKIVEKQIQNGILVYATNNLKEENFSSNVLNIEKNNS